MEEVDPVERLDERPDDASGRRQSGSGGQPRCAAKRLVSAGYALLTATRRVETVGSSVAAARPIWKTLDG